GGPTAFAEREVGRQIVRQDKAEALCRAFGSAADPGLEFRVKAPDDGAAVKVGQNVRSVPRQATGSVIEVIEIRQLKNPILDYSGSNQGAARRVRSEIGGERPSTEPDAHRQSYCQGDNRLAKPHATSTRRA